MKIFWMQMSLRPLKSKQGFLLFEVAEWRERDQSDCLDMEAQDFIVS